MDIEFHYHITYILSRKAGFEPDDAYTIAYASQYTDNNTYKYFVNFLDGSHFINEISQTFDITKPSETRIKIYPLFHFVPGGEEAEDTCSLKCGQEKCMAAVQNSENARFLLKDALDSGDLYRIGIAVHAYADTWSHQNFMGYKCKANGMKGLGKLVPNIGHADFLHEPDIIHNEWRDTRLKKSLQAINNDYRFIDAAKHIFVALRCHKNPGTSEAQAVSEWEGLRLENQLRDAMDESYFLGKDERARIKAYQKICSELKLPQYHYDSNAWRYAAVDKRTFEADLFDRYWAKPYFKDSPWYQFQLAVVAHRDLALRTFSPLFTQAGFHA